MDNIRIRRLDHHGIVSGIFSELGFEEIINDLIGIDNREVVSAGQAVKAMVMSGLGFTHRPLMLTPQFFSNLAVDELIGPGIKAEDLNRHKLGRTLDALAEKGCEGIFAVLASKACAMAKVDLGAQSLDTTSFSLTGQYDVETDSESIKVCHGYSKDHRPDLKQLVVELVVSQEGGIPLAMQTHSGNASDNTIFTERSGTLLQSLKESEPLRAWVADSKLYCAKNAEHLSGLPFITRIPRTNKVEREIVQKALACPDAWRTLQMGENRYQSFDVNHYDIDQRWLVVLSEQGLERTRKTISKAVGKEAKAFTKALFHFQAQRFACQEDASRALKKICAGLKYHELSEVTWTEHPVYEGRGRPSKNATPDAVLVQGQSSFIERDAHIEHLVHTKACFVVGTRVSKNVLSDQGIIQTYKAQASVETGFRFLKDPLFFTSSLFLKKPERLNALLMVMILALLIYAIAQKRLRDALAENGQTIPNQIGKPIQTPTMRWVFQCFEGIDMLSLGGNVTIHGLNEIRETILKIMGYKNVLRIYQISSG